VRCRRILLARKSITCSQRTMTRKDAIAEVAHLTRLSHAHIIRVIGTYVKGRELSILLYPVADCNLETFLDIVPPRSTESRAKHYATRKSLYRCLSSAVAYIHSMLTKHMDIKPQNILIIKRPVEPYVTPLIADFGISRAYQSPEEIETDGCTSFTKRYAAPEVVKQDFRGFPADVFSLGCVFLEILAALYKCDPDPRAHVIQSVLDANPQGDTSYQANITSLQYYLLPDRSRMGWPIDQLTAVILEMLNHDPKSRPTARNLISVFGKSHCCDSGVIQLKATPIVPI
jgi:serine/threonine protein kinase